MFISDRHKSNAHTLSIIFPKEHHGACTYHVKVNINHNFKTNHCDKEYELTAPVYQIFDFNHKFDKIKVKDPALAKYLEDIMCKEMESSFLSKYLVQYIMISNYVESFNSKSREGRRYPITIFVDFLRFTLQQWFYVRRDLVDKCNRHLAIDIEKDLRKLFEVARFLIVHPLSRFEFYVQDSEKDCQVILQTNTCTCKVFDLTGLPCMNVVLAPKLYVPG